MIVRSDPLSYSNAIYREESAIFYAGYKRGMRHALLFAAIAVATTFFLCRYSMTGQTDQTLRSYSEASVK
jgi:type VI protein secretion system component VasF